MRKLLIPGLVTAAAALALLGGILSGTSEGYAWGNSYEGPWCVIFGGSQGAIENCRMQTFEMCRQEAIGGNRGSCYPNPHWPGDQPQRSSLKRRR
jgi:hypothetical protein